jgi:quinol monooxygenase YgiN
MAEMTMILRVVFQPGKRDEGLVALSKMTPVVAGEEGVLHYSFHLDVQDEDVLWAIEVYSDRDALMAHTSTDELKELLATLEPLLAEPLSPAMATPARAGKGLPI